MPMDNILYYNEDTIFRDRCLGWEYKFSLIPRRCHYTNKMIWFENAYCGVACWTGPGEPIFEYRWVKKKEFLILKIKGTI